MLGRLLTPLRCALVRAASVSAAPVPPSTLAATPVRSLSAMPLTAAPGVTSTARFLLMAPTPLTTVGVTRSITLETLHKRLQNPPERKKKKRPLEGKPQMKGVVLKTLIKKPKKPNSANRRCVLVRLSNGKEMVAYVPGEGHNLQEHNIVLVRVGRLRDVPGVKIKCIRGKHDLSHVVKKTQS